ncbi:hypothetical protein CAEBREN_12716 [Caenorhabditis brenneri]|uniref:Uncharacterized protein n=1 Tax=Caenorhabditis brenneri TaxID=135651 RepID=G0M8X3_CAEBE|nr:hypothetical protein CAEBREN_12716 [Caenorhabditis brenneri]
MEIQSQAYLFSRLADTQMAALEGLIYITTEKQGKSGFFKVFDVDRSQIIRTSLLICDPCTMVFLNTNSQMTPVQSSTLSTWRQSPTSVVKMYKGVPTDDDEQAATQIFSNPIQGVYNEEIRMEIVEKFSVSLGAFYFKTTDDFYFVIQPYYSDLNTYTTTGYTSTGFYMKSKDQVPKNVTVLCVRDTRFNGTTGANVVGSLPNPNGKVTVGENDGDDNRSITVPPQKVINGWTTNHIGQNITINSVNSEGGEYFVQYFVRQGQLIPETSSMATTTSSAAVTTTTATTTFVASTTQNVVTSSKSATTLATATTNTMTPTTLPGSTTTGNVETTTKSSRKVQILLLLIVTSFVGFWQN